jgi:predicted MFS family arabinose efflux permease
VPYAKARLQIDDAELGLVLLGLGLGSVVAMPIAGGLVARHGSRPMILAAGLGLAAVLPLLAIVSSPLGLAASLLLFGVVVGAIDVAMNVHAVEVESAAGVPLMSGFHGLFSLGGLAGAASVTALLALGIAPLPAALAASAVVLVAVAAAMPRLLRAKPKEQPPMFALPHGTVVVFGLMAFAAFLTEGAMLDWGGLYLINERGLPPQLGGIAYALFSVAMVIGRLAGDRVIAALGGVRTILAGAALTTAGFAVLLLAPGALAAAGFLLVGLGAATRVPILFSAAGRQEAMPPALALAAMVTIGYAGVLAGPAAIGFVAQATSLPFAFVCLAVLMLLIPAFGRVGRALEGPT